MISTDYRICLWCNCDIRFSTSYDEPHWIHVSGWATLDCPGIGQGEGVIPADDGRPVIVPPSPDDIFASIERSAQR